MEIIYDIKRGETVSADILDQIIAEARTGGAEAVVLGCTELCVITSKTRDIDPAGDIRKKPGIINTLEVLAEASIAFFRD